MKTLRYLVVAGILAGFHQGAPAAEIQWFGQVAFKITIRAAR